MDREEVYNESLKYFNGDELAANVFVDKYCLKDGGVFLESTPDDMHRRLAKEFARIEAKYPNPMSEDEIYDYLKNFSKIVPQGSPMYGVGNPKPVSLSNCAVIDSPLDDMASIMETGKRMSLLYKRRYGVGVDLSGLRPEFATVNNAAETSTGAWSFADLYSYITRMVGQAGRRGALMITMDIKHPDIIKFITMKKDLTKVTGANVSVKVRDDFMEAVEANEAYTLQFPIDSDEPQYTKEVNALELWELLTETATETAEPGLMMWDNIISTLPAHCYPEFETISTNPCGELPLSAQDSCRLISINLTAFVKNAFTGTATFDYEAFRDTVSVGMRLNDDLVDLELEKIQQIIDCCDTPTEKEFFQKFYDAAENGRRTGLGTHGLADCMAMLTLRYDSDEAISEIDKIYATLANTAYHESTLMAEERGAFPAFDWELERNCKFFKNLDQEVVDRMSKVGRRNIALLTCAPTGSVSIESQTSSGVEPIFRLLYGRRKKLNHDQQHIDADFVDDLGDRWIEFEVCHHSLDAYRKLTGNDDIPEYFVTSDQISWEKRVEVQAAMQKYIDHSISSTINFPRGTQAEEVARVYTLGWKMGLKGVTVYVDGSRDGVLLTGEKGDKSFVHRDATKRPSTLDCEIHHVTVKGEKWMFFVGLLEGKPYEVFGGMASKVEIGPSVTVGKLHKRKFKTVPSKYDLELDTVVIKDITGTFDNADYAVMTRMVSLSLRHGAKPSFLVEQLLKDNDVSFASFNKVMSRVLKKYVEDGTKVSSAGSVGECPDGTPHDLIYQEGCVMCSKCGWTKCG